MGGGNRKGPRGGIRSWDTRSTIAAYVGAVVRKGYRRRPQCTFVWLMALFHCMVRHGMVHFWGVFHWVLYLVPDTFLVPLRSRFHASRTVTKT